MERLWRYMHREIIGAERRETFAEFDADVRYFFANMAAHESSLRQFIGTEMHLIELV